MSLPSGVKRILKSLRFRLWATFIMFAVVIVLVLWALQTVFLNNFYETMKVRETQEIAKQIAVQYRVSDSMDFLQDITIRNDMYIHIETVDGTIVFSPAENADRRPVYMYFSEMETARTELLESMHGSVSITIPEERTDTNTLAYAAFIKDANDNSAILYLFSPLYPVSSTIDILSTQLGYVTIIALVLAFVISFWMANRICRPINNITESAKKLARGKYDVEFERGDYTEITELADTLTYTAVELQKSTTLQRDLMANVSHDLKTPLTMVKSYAEMIRDLSGDNPQKRNAHLNVIIDEADRLNVLVDDMLSLSRLQSGVMVLDKKTFDLRTVLDGLMPSYALLCEQDGYTITCECPEEVVVFADEAKIKQVLTNFINNAVKYCGEDKCVDIRVTSGKYKVRCEITDHGMGIAPEEVGHIWERYYKASTNHVRAAAGIGLGLSIVKEILALHDARYGVKSTVGKGSVFWFELDRRKKD